MFVLYYSYRTADGLRNDELTFTANEEETARAMAQEYKARYGDVFLVDYRPGRTRKRVPVMESSGSGTTYNVWQKGTVLVTQPACEVIDLGPKAKKKPRKPLPPVAVAEEVFTPVRKARREFGVTAC